MFFVLPKTIDWCHNAQIRLKHFFSFLTNKNKPPLIHLLKNTIPLQPIPTNK